ncbi:MAG: NVEALA domain-containing protein [Bacteroides sp.]
MKKKLIFAGCLLIGVCISFLQQRHKHPMDELLLTNIEILASSESPIYTRCVGSGDVECPNGVKVAYYFIGYSLK